MPIYEYRCARCGHELDVLQKISDAPLKKCPECGKSKLERLMSAPSFRLKGSGWYETDFKSDGEKKRNLVESGDGAADKSDAAAEPAAKDGNGQDSAAKDAKDSKNAKDSKDSKPEATAADKKKPAAKKPAASPRKKASTKATRSASP